jgi:hypothetical protein
MLDGITTRSRLGMVMMFLVIFGGVAVLIQGVCAMLRAFIAFNALGKSVDRHGEHGLPGTSPSLRFPISLWSHGPSRKRGRRRSE